MFTGLIEDIGNIASFEQRGEAGVLIVKTALPTGEIAIGDSVAINGACFTVTAKSLNTLTFDISPESILKTLVSKLSCGSSVNMERALKLGDHMGGHIVSGHIDCIGQLSRIKKLSGNYELHFTLPSSHSRHLIEKGSVAIDGVSLTVNTVTNNGFAVNIIPHTYNSTTINSLQVGDQVNIETDIIGKYVERLTSPWNSKNGLSMKTLAENGFI